MRLCALHVHKFRNILSSGDVKIEPDISCLVGKNESGKTAFLQAVRKIKPVTGGRKFNRLKDYPAWREKTDARTDGTSNIRAVTATFKLDESAREAIQSILGPILKDDRILVHCNYEGLQTFECQVDEPAYVQNLVRRCLLPDTKTNKFSDLHSLCELRSQLAAAKKSRSSNIRQAAGYAEKLIREEVDVEGGLMQTIGELIVEHIPSFLYFSDYSKLPSDIWVKQVLEKPEDERTDAEHTAACLLELGGADEEALIQQDYETRKRELENVANQLTRDALHYWTTNTQLRVLIDLSKDTRVYRDKDNGRVTRKDEFRLRIRVHDDSHGLSLPLAARSSGFQWFFSFLAAFSEYETTEEPLVLLLDEPGVGLHARAQADFLRFIEERLAKRCQVIYTTHSPFMVQPSKLHRCRVVQDNGADVGTTISDNVLTTDKDTTFPLQAALGYDLAQNLFLGEYALVVEGISDFIYLDTMSQWLKDNERQGLADSIVITPVGGSSKVPTFVALMAPRKIRFNVLVDSSLQERQQIEDLKQSQLLRNKHIIELGRVLGKKEADIEDLFEPEDYIYLYNLAFGTKLSTDNLDGLGTVVKQVCKAEGLDHYNHTRVAKVLARSGDEAISKLQQQTLMRFEKLFKRINQSLESIE